MGEQVNSCSLVMTRSDLKWMSPIKNGVAIGSYNGAYNKFSDSNNVTKKGY